MSDVSAAPEGGGNRKLNRAVGISVVVLSTVMALGKVKDDELVVRLGEKAESYEGIGKEKVNVAGRICVADAEGQRFLECTVRLRTRRRGLRDLQP